MTSVTEVQTGNNNIATHGILLFSWNFRSLNYDKLQAVKRTSVQIACI
jgi:hypothetical protein